MSRAFPLRVLVLSALVACLASCAGSRARYGPRTPAPAWSWVNPLPQGHTLNDVWRDASGAWVAVGGHGTVLVREGSEWRLASSGTDATLRGVWGSDMDDLYAVGDKGTIVHYDGFAWSVQDSGTSENLQDVIGFPSGDVFVVGHKGVALRLKNSNWVSFGSGTKNLTSIWGSSQNDLIAVGEGGHAQVYDGSGWIARPTGEPARNLRSVFGWGSTTNAIAVGQNGRIYERKGPTWERMSTPVNRTLHAVWGAAKDDAYAAGNNGTLLHHDGTGWNEVQGFSTPRHLLGGTAAHASESLVVGRRGYVTTGSTNGSWTELSSGFEDDLAGVWVVDDDDAWVVGPNGKLASYDGTAWTEYPNATTADLAGIWANADGSQALAVGSGGTILEWDGSWSTSTSGVTADLNGVWGAGPNGEAYAVGDNAVVLRRGGSGWVREGMPPGFVGDAQAVWGDGGDELWIATSKGLWQLAGGTWSKVRQQGNYTGGASAGSGSTTFTNLAGDFGYVLPNGAEDEKQLHKSPSLRDSTLSVHGLAVGDGGAAGLLALGPGNDVYFSEEASGTNGDLLSVSDTSSKNILAVGPHGRVLRHDRLWNQLGKPSPLPIDQHALHDLWIADTGELFVAGSDDGVFARASNSTWTDLNAPQGLMRAVYGSSKDDVWVAAWDGGLHRWDGTGWTSHDPGGGTWRWMDLWVRESGDVWAVGELGAVAHRQHGVWTYDRFPNEALVAGVWGVDTGDPTTSVVFAVDSDGHVRRNVGGAGWTIMHTASDSLRAIWGTSENDLFVAGDGGLVLRYDGTDWKRMATQAGVDLRHISGTSSTDVWVGGDQAELLHFDGKRWTRRAVPVDDLDLPGREAVQGLWHKGSQGPYVLSRTRVMVSTE